MSWDCSELSEAARLIGDLLSAPGREPEAEPAADPQGAHLGAAPTRQSHPLPSPEEEALSVSPFRGDRLEALLEGLCRRAGFMGAVVADESGLPLAATETPVDPNRVAAFSAVLGQALDKAESLLGGHLADNVSVDFNYTDKLVLRHFTMDTTSLFLAVICPQEVDERGEIELTMEQIAVLLSSA